MIKLPHPQKKSEDIFHCWLCELLSRHAGSHDICFIPPLIPFFFFPLFSLTVHCFITARERAAPWFPCCSPTLLSGVEPSWQHFYRLSTDIVADRVLPRGISQGEAQVIWKQLGSAPRGRRRRSLVLPGVSGDGCELKGGTVCEVTSGDCFVPTSSSSFSRKPKLQPSQADLFNFLSFKQSNSANFSHLIPSHGK